MTLKELIAFTLSVSSFFGGIAYGQNPPTPVPKPRSYPAIKLSASGAREPTETEKALQEDFDRVFQRMKKQEPMDPDSFFRATVNEEVVGRMGPPKGDCTVRASVWRTRLS